jgi:hypothetical protein
LTLTQGTTAETITALLNGVRRIIAHRFVDISKKTLKNQALPGLIGPVLLPGLTAPVLFVGSPRAKTVHKRPIRRDVLSLAASILDLRAWRDMDPLACLMLAGYTAVIVQPFIYGSLGGSLVALMTPLK